MGSSIHGVMYPSESVYLSFHCVVCIRLLLFIFCVLFNLVHNLKHLSFDLQDIIEQKCCIFIAD